MSTIWEIFNKSLSGMITDTEKSLRYERFRTGCWWFTPVILATWEAEIGRIAVRG
jgi:hypothetical protein